MTEQTWCADGYEKNARFVSDLGMPVVGLLNARPGERILDLGCGDGVLTRKLQEVGCEVVGIDSSPELIDAAFACSSTSPFGTPARSTSPKNSTPCSATLSCTGSRTPIE